MVVQVQKPLTDLFHRSEIRPLAIRVFQLELRVPKLLFIISLTRLRVRLYTAQPLRQLRG